MLSAPTFPPGYQHIPSSSSDSLGLSACSGFSAGSSSKLSLQTCQGDETHERIERRKRKVKGNWVGGKATRRCCVTGETAFKLGARLCDVEIPALHTAKCMPCSSTLDRGSLLDKFTPSFVRSFFSSSFSTSCCRECWGIRGA